MIKRIISRAICLMVSAILMIGVCGCMNTSTNNPKFTVDEILRYMNEKYGEEFTYIEPVDVNQPTASSFAVFVTTGRFENEKIFVECVLNTADQSKTYTDNYHSYLYKEETRKLLTDLTVSIYPDAKVRYAIEKKSSSSDDSVGILSFEDYLSRSSSSISYMIMLSPDHDTSTYKEEFEMLFEKFKENGVVCRVTIAYAEDANQYDTFVCDAWTSEFEKYKLHGNILINSNFDIVFEEWR